MNIWPTDLRLTRPAGQIGRMSEMAMAVRGKLRERAAEEIRVLLARRRISAAELARRTGMKQSTMARRMTGETAFDLDDLEAIAAVLGVDVTELLPGPTGGSHRQNWCSVPKTKRSGGTRRPSGDNRPKGRPVAKPTPPASTERISARRPRRLTSVNRPMPAHPA